MPDRQDVLEDRRFWASLCASAFGQIGEPPEGADICAHVGVDEQSTLDWCDSFRGWSPDVFDESDGVSDDPATVRVVLSHGHELRVEFDPGDIYWFLSNADGAETTLATVGPHWTLPGLRWQEAAAIADAAPGEGWAATLLLLPIVWLTAGDDVLAARQYAEAAWSASRLLSAEQAGAMANAWVNAVAEGGSYHWRRVPDIGWVCDASWSTRAAGRATEDIALLNRLVEAASSGN